MGFALTFVYIAVLFLTPPALLPSMAAYRIQLWIGIAAIACSIPALLTDRQWRSPQLLFFAGLFVCIPLSLIIGPAHYFGGAVEAVTKFVPNAILLILLSVNCRSLSRLKVIVFVLLLVTSYFVVSGAEDYYAKSQKSQFVITQHIGENEDELLFRIRGLGVLNDPNDFAQFMIVLLPFVWLGWRKDKRIRIVLLAAPITAFLVWGMFLTHSRGAVVTVPVVLLIAFRRRLGTMWSTIFSGAVVFGLLVGNFAGGRQVSLETGSDRVALWGEGLDMFKSSPIFGVGFGEFADKAGQTAHNSFVLCLAELGLVGYFCWIAIIVFTLSQLHDLIESKTVDVQDEVNAGDNEFDKIKRFAIIARLSLVGFLATSWFLSRTYSATCWLVLGISIATIQLGRGIQPSTSTNRMARLMRWSATAEFASITLVYVIIRVSNL